MMFGVNNPSQPGSWMPYMQAPDGTGIPLLAAARSVSAGQYDAAGIQISGGSFWIVFTNNNNTSGTIGSMTVTEGGAAG
jgi:hypothetical protein